MPRVNIYIRIEDWEAWEAVVSKPEFIHDALQDRSPEIREYNGLKSRPLPDLYTDATKGTNTTVIIPHRTPVVNREWCKNGHPMPEGRDRCIWKGCKYS